MASYKESHKVLRKKRSSEEEDPSVSSTKTRVRSKNIACMAARKSVSVGKKKKSGAIPPLPSSIFDELMDNHDGFPMDPAAYQLTGELPGLDIPTNFRQIDPEQVARMDDHAEAISKPVRREEEEVAEDVNQHATAITEMTDDPQQVKKCKNGKMEKEKNHGEDIEETCAPSTPV